MISGVCVYMYREVKIERPRFSLLQHFHVMILDLHGYVGRPLHQEDMKEKRPPIAEALS